MTKRAYQGIDHVVIRAADAAPLFELFTDQFGLPVTWPLERATFATFGWIGLGNTNLEIWAATDNSDLPADCPFPLIHQIAFAPVNLLETLARVRATGLSCKLPRAYASKDERGEMRTNFTNSVVLELSKEFCCVFFCEWGNDAPIVPWKKGLSTLERRNLEKSALTACGGGPLGLVALKEIAMSSTDLVGALDGWQNFAASSACGSVIAIADDVELQLSAGKQDLFQSLTLAVRDLTEAKRFLGSRGLLEKDSVSEVMISLRATGGLRFRLVQAVTEHENANFSA